MEARKGYKKTELGCLPIGWEVWRLSETATYRRGSFPQPYGLDEWYDDENGHPFVQVFDVGDNMRLKENTKRRISNAAAEKSVFVEKGTLLLTLQGSIGRIAITHYDAYVDRTLLIFQSFLNPTDIRFFMYVVHRLFDIEKRNAPGSTIKTITKERLSSFLVPFPPLPEQLKIAEILTTVDDKIESIANRIQQTEQLKKGLMEKLLTEGIGHTEFKDTKIGRIPSSWDVLAVGEVYEKSVELGDNMYPIASISIDLGIVRREKINRQLISDLPPEKHLLVKKGYLAYNMMRMWQGASGIADFDCIVSPAYVVCKPIRKVFPKYSSYYFKSPKNIILLKRFSKGITEDRWRLYYNDFSKIPFVMPPYNEQEKIATILSTVDDKLDVLRSKKTNYETLKRGLMEQLLTGKMLVKP